MKKNLTYIAIVLVLVLLVSGFFLWKKNSLEIATETFQTPSSVGNPNVVAVIDNIQQNETGNEQTSGENVTDFPLTLPKGFRISVFAKNLAGARVMLFDSLGNMWVSRSTENVVTMLEIQNGKVVEQKNVLTDLNNPHGLVIDPDDPFLMYIGEEDKITKIRLNSDAKYEKIVDLPFPAGHSTRTLIFGPDKKLLVSIGSSCNVCNEDDQRRAAIYSLDRDGKNFQMFAGGLRNSVFMDINPLTNEIWATEMGRDRLGDNIPPDEINIIRQGENYGWPYCYGKQEHDSVFDSRNEKIEFCRSTTPSIIDVPAHSAPLGLAFLKSSNLPSEYANDILVSYHGSWNRSVPTGYKVVRHQFDSQGNYLGVEDFITGWLDNGAVWGRPVGILDDGSGRIFISDDKAGVIYLLEYLN